MTCGIYLLRNRLNSKIYVGSSTNIEERFRYHQGAYGTQMVHRAIRKHGSENFDYLLLEECPENALVEVEQRYLDELQPFGETGYNIRRVAERNTGIVLREETRKKMSEVRRGVPKSEDHKNKLREAGKRRDNSHLDAYRGRSPSVETRAKQSRSMQGKMWRHDEERVKKHRERLLGKKHSPEHVEKVRRMHSGSKRSYAARRRMSDRQQRLYSLTSPTGDKFSIYSRDLKRFAEEYELSYANICAAAKNRRPYKGWYVIVSF